MTTQLDMLDRCLFYDSVKDALSRVPDTFSADDLHEQVVGPTEVNRWGIVFAQLQRDGLIKRHGWAKSTRPQANGRYIATWEKV